MALIPPLNFGPVENGIYRSATPNELNFSFLETLRLKTVILLSDTPDEGLSRFMETSSINCIYIDSTIKSSAHSESLTLLSEDTVSRALTILADSANLPVLVACESGRHINGVVVGCLRKIQRWCLASVYEEYRRFAGYTGSSTQRQHEQFMELYDIDLINILDTAPPFLLPLRSSRTSTPH